MSLAFLHAPATPRDAFNVVKYERDVQLHTGSMPMNRADAERRLRRILNTVSRVPRGLTLRDELDSIVRSVFAKGREVFPEDYLEQSDPHRLFLLRALSSALTERLEQHVRS
jgi:hypothetical protein